MAAGELSVRGAFIIALCIAVSGAAAADAIEDLTGLRWQADIGEPGDAPAGSCDVEARLIDIGGAGNGLMVHGSDHDDDVGLLIVTGNLGNLVTVRLEPLPPTGAQGSLLPAPDLDFQLVAPDCVTLIGSAKTPGAGPETVAFTPLSEGSYILRLHLADTAIAGGATAPAKAPPPRGCDPCEVSAVGRLAGVLAGYRVSARE